MVAKTTTKAPASLARRTAIGAAPDPVPPPRPTQMKTILRSRNTSRISFSDSKIAFSPISGSPPAPRPFVRLGPNWIFSPATEPFRVRTSVFRASNSAPSIPSRAIRSSILAPAPPKPIIFTALSGMVCWRSLGNSIMTGKNLRHLYQLPPPVTSEIRRKRGLKSSFSR